MSATERDSFDWRALRLLWPWLALGVFACVLNQIDRCLQLSLLAVPIFMLALTVTGIVWFVQIGSIVRQRLWRQLAIAPAAPVLLIGALARIGITADWLDFRFARWHYLHAAEISLESPPKHLERNWGETGSAINLTNVYTLVYDDTDHPLERMKSAGQTRHESADAYGQHFFLFTQTF
jgi:hypothetical protein